MNAPAAAPQSPSSHNGGSDAEVYDVLVVGLGPVGLTLAGLLGRRGRRVCVVEQYADSYPLPRAGHFDGEIMRIFQDLGIADEIELLARPVFEYDLVDATGRALHSVEFGGSGTGWKSDYLFYQPELEEILERTVRDLPTVTVHRSTRAVGLVQNERDVVLDTQTTETHPDGAGNARRFRGRYLVGADGRSGFVRSAVGLDYTDLGFSPLRYLVCDFELADPDGAVLDFGEVRQTLDPARPALFGRWNGNRWCRWEFMVLPGEDAAEMETEEQVWKLVAPWGVTPADGRFVRRSVYTFDAQICRTPRAGRVLLAGDAFHLMPPFMAQGMCSGVRDAMNLAWKLDAVLGGADDRLLDTYAEERVPHAAEIVRLSVHLAEVCTVTDPEQARARDERYLRGEVPGEAMPVLTAGLLHRDAAGAVVVPAGRLSPQGRVHRGGRTGRLDDLLPSGWHLVTRHPVRADALGEHHRMLLDRLDVQLAHVTRGMLADSFLDLDGTYELWFRRTGCQVLLQRPDFVVFGAVPTLDELPALLDDLYRQTVDTGLLPSGLDEEAVR
ncbi:bifunctional 3-(3-hydroxy-phenyl)propionate/3-hydroxycinnamic acid hydroxylase [Nocardia carnea]|uniref:bifunctional 3-(3-hydroxy-phenyl)propionate/3-hydroxycinnamic acid hydroxylase n=1 Tax=Nocardia carnea TaxID=37328 RepID=UPI0024576116|nr:bifunctional 3-(3-hydroxy-phenyl)propionate/3-hydroxycinnamic acid hydroxylase [Nocardia carnea]